MQDAANTSITFMLVVKVGNAVLNVIRKMKRSAQSMRILIACESSGTVRDAMIAAGHDAVSCDLLPAERPGPHIQGDVLAVINDGWDMMIAHPPCTHLAVSGARYFEEKRKDGRQQAAIDFFMQLANASIPRIAIENPVGIMSRIYRKPDQIIQPWMFGEDASKKTCLWLKGLPKLQPTKVIIKERYANQTASGQNNLPPSPDRWKLRSKTYQGIANAIKEQWGNQKNLAPRVSADSSGVFLSGNSHRAGAVTPGCAVRSLYHNKTLSDYFINSLPSICGSCAKESI